MYLSGFILVHAIHSFGQFGESISRFTSRRHFHGPLDFRVPEVMLLSGCSALKDLKLFVPMAVIRGHDAVLNCTYDLEGDDLYSVKWYRHDREFFRYTPNDEMPVKQFRIQGLSLDVRERDSSATRIVLENVSDDISGVFSCEVTADQPSFFTDMKASHLEVVELPRNDPHISGLKTKYRLGEMLRANCTSESSYPAANLTWYVNDYPADAARVHKHKRLNPDGHFQRDLLDNIAMRCRKARSFSRISHPIYVQSNFSTFKAARATQKTHSGPGMN
ncbi:hypothetical protein WA026_001202 [Henosepilachna vigintioctopunctata]|uniref:Ig-like domain-containing protein n=1 Tax=Henosepilachna vigintioctopunctata TaxID=420089 RepID=A0AAW1UHM0_9CUCU